MNRKVHHDVAEDARNRLRALRLGEAMYSGGFTIFPLYGESAGRSPYRLLNDAIDRKEAKVDELPGVATVPALMLYNEGAEPVLVTEGEILIGGKQHRLANFTTLAAAHASTPLVVSCVEQGRWGRSKGDFRSEYTAPSRVRSARAESRRDRGFSASEQSVVWERVQQSLHLNEAQSETSSLLECYESRRESLEDAVDGLPYPAGAVGLVACSAKRVLGLDVFDSPESMATRWKGLLNGYLMDALGDGEAPARSAPSTASEFVARAARTLTVRPSRPGLGTPLAIVADGLDGSGVWYAERLCHLSAVVG